jgi:serine/threonine protein kinase/tetratricopeptide (TPR) repeat protein
MSITASTGTPPDGSSFPLSPDPKPTNEALAQLLAQELGARWRSGDPIRVEDYLARNPELVNHPETAVRLIYEEMCVRRELGDEAPSDEYFQRFPQWRRSLEMVLECHHFLEPDLAGPIYPAVGDTLGDFQLVAELGRGLQGRVFLATQPALADRPLVLKLTPRSGREHLSLARLQHTHIVPLFFVQEDVERRLLILGMPWFGGATFAQILRAPDESPRGTTSGQDLLQTVDRIHSSRAVAYPACGRARYFLSQASAVQAVCWIGACLADALQYAHERGLVHLDVKPPNVLLTADGLPMLLDFHLAREPLQPEAAVPVWLGGTPAYMSPEQQAALAALRAGKPVPAVVDGRSDVYSLGLLLLELAGGPASLRVKPGGSTPLPSLPVGLFDILKKCLADDPAQRYASAGDLAADLRRQMADLPLRGVRNRSLVERWRKWRRRRPHGAALLGLLAMALAGLTAATLLIVLQFNHRWDEARQALEVGQRQVQNHQYDDALSTLRRGRELANGLPGIQPLAAELDRQVRLAEQARTAEELHRVADRVRFLCGADFPPPDRSRALEAQCWDIWERRDLIIERLSRDVSLQAKQHIQADLLDLAILWTELHVHLASVDAIRSSCQDALHVLDQAEARFGPSPALLQQRKAYAETAGLREIAEAADRRALKMPPQTAWEHYALGRSLLRAGSFKEAAPYFDRALALKPQDFWAYYYKGLCAYRLNQFQDAVLGFTGCVILSPESAEPYFNRALALTALERTDQALRDYDHALRLDLALAPAALNRGLLHFREKRPQLAIRDLQTALRNGEDAATVHFNLALVYQSQDDRTAALASLQAALLANPQHRDARQLQEKLLHQP